MSALLECVGCGVGVELSLADAFAEGWARNMADDVRGIWTCPSCAAADDDIDRQVHEMIEERAGGESR